MFNFNTDYYVEIVLNIYEGGDDEKGSNNASGIVWALGEFFPLSFCIF